MSQMIVYLDCHSGISGNMFLGALFDAGLSFEDFQRMLAMLPLSNYQLVYEHFSDKGIRGSHFDVRLLSEEQAVRHLSDIQDILQFAPLSLSVRERALNIFQCLAEAEATVHGTSVAEVHFHEVGAVDAIIDIVGASWAIEALNIGQIYASSLPLSSGHVKTAHGLLPVPAPATLEILRRVEAPWRPVAAEGEMVTPTGAAILATLARFETPALTIQRTGYGFGHKQFPWPNCLRACLGQPLQAEGTSQSVAETDWVSVIACNIDNMTGEALGDLMEQLLQAGALDVSYLPLQMKKNRPAVQLTVISQPLQTEKLVQAILARSSTLGVRIQEMQRRKAQRSQERIETPLGPMVIKVKLLGSRIISAAPEYEECRRIADARHLSLAEVYEVAHEVIARTIIPTEEK